jgi:hypothetical protein
MRQAAMPLLAHSPVRAMAIRCAARWTCFQFPFLLTLKSALQRCAFYFVHRGAAAVLTMLSIHGTGVHFPAMRCLQVTPTRPSDTDWIPTGIECSHWVCGVV